MKITSIKMPYATTEAKIDYTPRRGISFRPYGEWGPLISVSLRLFGFWLLADIYRRCGIIAGGRKMNFKTFEWELRLPRKIRWMWLRMFPPLMNCPKCGSKKHVTRGRDVSCGRKVYRCVDCFVKWDNFYRRYPWRS